MKVLMLGWEFPPFISGGLGTACFGLTKALSEIGVEILFVLPKMPEGPADSHVKFLTRSRRARRRRGRRAVAQPVQFRTVPTTLRPYGSASPDAAASARAAADDEDAPAVVKAAATAPVGSVYDGNVLEKAEEYAELVCELAAEEDFDVIHAHDWMTFAAGRAVAKRSGRPLLVHVHATEFDRSGDSVNPAVYELERLGTNSADGVFAVSKLTKGILVRNYGVSAGKIEVVYNAVLHDRTVPRLRAADFRNEEKVVLFLGRITMQKGPEYFLLSARKLLEVMGDVRFVMAGNGDLMHKMVEMSAELGIGHKVMFTGFLRGAEVERAFRMSDVYVMPSVSEPFGITPLEAMLRGVPAVISKQSGAAEVISHALKVDFWDTVETANKLAALLRDPILYRELSDSGLREARGFNWTVPARRCLAGYRRVVAS